MPKKKTFTLDYELNLPSQHELIKFTEDYCQNKPIFLVLRENMFLLKFMANEEQAETIRANSGILKIYSNQILRGSENIS